MIFYYTPFMEDFPYEQSKEMYEENQKLIEDDNDFDNVIKHTFFLSFVDENKDLLGCIYFYKLEDDKLYVNAFADRGHHEINLKALKFAMNGFDEDIYAKTHQRTAKLCLNRLGFEKLNEELYVYRR